MKQITLELLSLPGKLCYLWADCPATPTEAWTGYLVLPCSGWCHYSTGHPWRGVSSNAAFNITQEICLCLLVLVFQLISFLTKWKLVSNSTRGSKTLPGRIRRGSRTWNSLGASGDGASVKGDSMGKRALGTCIQLTGCIQTWPQWPTGGGWPRGELSTSIPIVNGIIRFLGKKRTKQTKKISSFRLPPSTLSALVWLSRTAASSPYSGKANPTRASQPATGLLLGKLLVRSPGQEQIPKQPSAGVAWHGSSPRAARGHRPSPGFQDEAAVVVGTAPGAAAAQRAREHCWAYTKES